MTTWDALTLLGPTVCGLAALSHWWRYRAVTRGGVVADATVVAIAEEEARDSYDRTYRPTVEFRTASGRTMTAPCAGYHDAQSRSDATRVGDRVRVLYHPDRPDDVILVERYRTGYLTLTAVAIAWVALGSLVRAFPSP